MTSLLLGPSTLTTPRKAGGIKPQYIGIKQLQTRAWKHRHKTKRNSVHLNWTIQVAVFALSLPWLIILHHLQNTWWHHFYEHLSRTLCYITILLNHLHLDKEIYKSDGMFCLVGMLMDDQILFLWYWYQAPFTWMSSSLELKSETRAFCPSATRVRDTHSRPEASVCALDGRSRWSPPRKTFTRLNVGCKGPRLRFRASLATSMTSSQHFSTSGIEE